MLEVIGTGILLYIGFLVAPMILAGVVFTLAIIVNIFTEKSNDQ